MIKSTKSYLFTLFSLINLYGEAHEPLPSVKTSEPTLSRKKISSCRLFKMGSCLSFAMLLTLGAFALRNIKNLRLPKDTSVIIKQEKAQIFVHQRLLHERKFGLIQKESNPDKDKFAQKESDIRSDVTFTEQVAWNCIKDQELEYLGQIRDKQEQRDKLAKEEYDIRSDVTFTEQVAWNCIKDQELEYLGQIRDKREKRYKLEKEESEIRSQIINENDLTRNGLNIKKSKADFEAKINCMEYSCWLRANFKRMLKDNRPNFERANQQLRRKASNLLDFIVCLSDEKLAEMLYNRYAKEFEKELERSNQQLLPLAETSRETEFKFSPPQNHICDFRQKFIAVIAYACSKEAQLSPTFCRRLFLCEQRSDGIIFNVFPNKKKSGSDPIYSDLRAIFHHASNALRVRSIATDTLP